MAADTVDHVVRGLGSLVDGRVTRRSSTKKLRLRGAEGFDALASSAEAQTRWLASRYGGEAEVVLAMIQRDPSLGSPLVPGGDYLRAEAVYAARYEMARSLTDVLARRTRALLVSRDASAAVAADVAALIAPDMGWSPEECGRQVAAYRAVVEADAQALVDVPESAVHTP
jgi:glycerol-3-phosphate dehydrogenase